MGTVGCENAGNGAATVGYGFVDAIVSGDYEKAYDYCYSGSEDLNTKEEFADRYKNIFEAMEVTSVTLTNQEIVENEDYYTINYTLAFESSLLGSFSYDYSADIMPGRSGYDIIYTPSLILPQMESGDTVRLKTLKGERGEIFDRNKNLLAENGYAQTVYFETAEITDINATLSAVGSIVEIDSEKALEKYNNAVEKGYDTEVIATFPRNTLSQEQIDSLTAIQGIKFDDSSMTKIRYYPYEDAFAHMVGYVGSPSDEELEADDTIDENYKIGKSGIESVYEQQLRGSDGKGLYIFGSNGKIKETLYEDKNTNGQDIVLTLDANEQMKAYTALTTTLQEGQSGAVVVLDAKTAETLAAVSTPSFDPNLFGFPMDSNVWNYLNSEDSGTPLFNRVTQATFPPGSTFKPFSIVPAYESGKIGKYDVPSLNIEKNSWRPDSSIPNVDNWVYPNINRSEETLGEFNMMNAMKSSDNIFYAYTALLAGIDDFMAYMNEIGIGEAPEYELPIKASTLLNEGTEMNIKILADMGYGMGELEISPLQLATMYTAFTNDGDILNPYIVEGIYDTTDGGYNAVYKGERKVWKSSVMKADTLDTLREALDLVVSNGTAYKADVPGLSIMGKTGTATLAASGENSREVNWLILIGKDEGNEKIVLVMVDTKANEGKDIKLSIGKEMITPDWYDPSKYDGSGDDEEDTDSDSEDTGEGGSDEE